MKFQYTALTTDNKKISGVLDLPDREAVEAELHRMGVAIISVVEISGEEFEKFETEQEALKIKRGIKTFQFIAIDPTGKEVEGTIDALDDFSAYRRLREEYKFTVLNLFPPEASEADREKAKALIPGFDDQMRAIKAAKKEERGAKAEEMENGEEMNREIVEEIDRVIINCKKAMETHANLFSNDLTIEIQNTLGELERVRTSNNIKHITGVANDLYALISHPDKGEDTLQDASYKAIVNEIGDSALVQRQFELYAKAIEATGLKRIFGDVGKRLKEMGGAKEGGEEKPQGFFGKMRAKFGGGGKKTLLPKFRKGIPVERKHSKWGDLMRKLSDYLNASSPVLKKTRQRELKEALRALFSGSKETEGEVAGKKGVTSKGARAERAPSGFWVEADSFVGWLLCFYILYFYLAEFSIEKGVGLNREFIFRTLRSPLLLNVALSLLIVHWAIRARNLHFRHNPFATLFLLFLSVGACVLVIVNF